MPQRARAKRAPTPAEGVRGEVRDLRFTVLDLRFTTVSLDGAVADTTSTEAVTITLSADVFFAFDKSDLSGKGRQALRDVVGRLKDAKDPVEVDGYTDAVGTAAYNKRLSRERAETVKKALAEAG